MKNLKISEIVTNYVKNSDAIDIIHTDQELKENDINSMKAHNRYYTRLLETYVRNADISLKRKMGYKKFFFIMCCTIMIITALTILVLTIIGIIGGVDIGNLVISFGANLLSFLASFIVLPQIIANYLFNSEEEKNMVDIVKSIQEYDKEIRNNLK